MKTHIRLGALILCACITLGSTGCGTITLRQPPTAIPVSATPISSATSKPVTPIAQVATPTVSAPDSASVISSTAVYTSAVVEHIQTLTPMGSQALQASRAVVAMTLDGAMTGGKQSHDELVVERSNSTGFRPQTIVMSGSLTTRAFSDLTKSELAYKLARTTLYKSQTGAYLMAQYSDGHIDNCAHLDYYTDSSFMDSPVTEVMLQQIKRYLVGRLVSVEQVNGVRVKHYLLDATEFNAVIQKSEDYTTRLRLGGLNLTGGDVYLADEGAVLVRLSADFTGSIKDLDFNGKMHFDYDLTRLDNQPQVVLPSICTGPEAEATSLRDIANPTGLVFSLLSRNMRMRTSTYTITLAGHNSAGNPFNATMVERWVEDKTQGFRAYIMDGSLVGRLLAQTAPSLLSVDHLASYIISGTAYMMLGEQCKSYPLSNAASLDAASPESSIDTSFTGILYGTLLPSEVINGIEVSHYQVDVEQTNRLNTKSREKIISGDVYLATVDRYPVRVNMSVSGPQQGLDFTGNADMSYELMPTVNAGEMHLPKACLSGSGL